MNKYYWNIVTETYKELGREYDTELIKALVKALDKADEELREAAKDFLSLGEKT